MAIENKYELECAWNYVHYTESHMNLVNNKAKVQERLKAYKKEIREYNHKQEQEEKVEHFVLNSLEYGGWNLDYTVTLIGLPDTIKTEKQAESYFHRNIEIDIPPTEYNFEFRTGQLCTLRYKICQRNGRFYVYHFVGPFNI